MSERPPTLIIADDHTALRARVEKLLTPRFTVVASVGDGLALLESTERLHPQVLVVDLDMPRMGGLEAIRALRAKSDTTPAVVISITEDSDVVSHALAAGAIGYVYKSRLADDLAPAVDAALHHTTFVSPPRSERGTTS